MRFFQKLGEAKWLCVDANVNNTWNSVHEQRLVQIEKYRVKIWHYYHILA